MTYDLPVMDERVKPHQVTTLHMVCALAFIVTGAIIVVYNYTIPLWGAAILVTGILLTIAVMAKNRWVISKKVNPVFRIAELAMGGSIFAYSLMQQWKFPAVIFGALSAAIIFALYWERAGSSAPTVHIDDEGVQLPVTARKRFRPWTEVEAVILRFGTITIDFTDNSFVQWEVPGSIENDPLEKYCIEQIEANRSKRRNDDW